METRYYSDTPGPGGEYKLALHASKNVFDRITGHLERKARIQEALDKETAHRQYLRDAGKAMTDEWENSVENLRKRKQQARKQRLAQTADDRVEQYYKVLKSQEEQRKSYNEKVKDKIFITRGAQKEINSGVLRSDCLYVNQKLIELKNSEKEKDQLDWKEYEEKILREDKKLEEQEILKQCKRRVKAEKYLQSLKQQVSENRKKEEEELKLKLEMESFDIVRQKEEMDSIEKNSQEDSLKIKQCALKTLWESREELKRRCRLEKKQDEESKIICDIVNDTRRRINCMREKIRKQDIKERSDCQRDAFRRLEDIKNKISSNEDIFIVKAIAEHEEIDNQKRIQKEAYETNLVEERKQNYKEALESRKIKSELEKEEKKSQACNRMKFMEVHNSTEMKKREEKFKNMERWREILFNQIKENEQTKLEEKAKENAFCWNDYPKKDRMFLEYGADMIAERKAKGTSTYPIELAILEYKRINGLLERENKVTNRCGKNEKDEVKLPPTTRRICQQKNNSSGVRDCFCYN